MEPAATSLISLRANHGFSWCRQLGPPKTIRTHPAMAASKPGARLVYTGYFSTSARSQIWSGTHIAYLRVQVSAAAACKECRGKGAVECEGCKGTGKNKNGNIFERWKCFDCQGFGMRKCPSCGKKGLTPEQRGER
ncbi:hypothetical protein ACQ4PT_072306 [Festuca glaucescens]